MESHSQIVPLVDSPQLAVGCEPTAGLRFTTNIDAKSEYTAHVTPLRLPQCPNGSTLLDLASLKPINCYRPPHSSQASSILLSNAATSPSTLPTKPTKPPPCQPWPMYPFNNHPDAIKRIRGQGFVDYTITRRLPKILANIEAQLEGQTAQTMLQAIITGSPIDTTIFARPTAYWNNYLDQLSGLTWDNLPFFDLEFLFYHGLNSIAGYFDTGVDVFHQARQRALAEAIPDLATGLDQISTLSGLDLLRATILGALFANEADYSQLITSRGDSSLWHKRILLDESEQWLSSLQQNPKEGDIHIIVDNAGHELCWDLVMVDALLKLFNNIRVVIHVKPWPMFVSDALFIDVEKTINTFLSNTLSDNMRLVGQRLKAVMECNRLRIQAEADWGEPKHFNALDQTIEITLSNSISVISKGDLNYRRLVQDLQWPMKTPVDIAAAGVPFNAFALRVLKSDALVGLESSVAETAAAQFSDWRTRGHFAVMQLL